MNFDDSFYQNAWSFFQEITFENVSKMLIFCLSFSVLIHENKPVTELTML